MWKLLGEQWLWLFLGFPFMFAGSIIEFLIPNYIGKILNEFRAENWDGEGGVYPLLTSWTFWLFVSAVSSFIREITFGVTS